MGKFKVTTNGDLMLGYKKEEVRKNLVHLCNYDAEMLKQLFSGLPFTFKTGLDEASAARYKQALDKTGIVCSIEPLVAEIRIQIDTHGSHAISHHPRSKEELMMVCPKCNERQPKRQSCVSCGVVIDKIIRQQQQSGGSARAYRPPKPVADKNQDSGSRWLLWLAVFFALVAVGYLGSKFLSV